MAKTKEIRISVNQFEKFVKTIEDNDIDITLSDDLSFKVKTKIGIRDMITFVNSVVDNCFDGDEYKPYYKKLIYAKNLISYFTNISIPLDDEKFYDWVTISGICDSVEEKLYNANSSQFHEINNTIDEMIEFRKQQIINKSPMSDLFATIDNIVSSFGDTFNAETIKEILPLFKSFVKNGGLNEKELMQAWFDIKNKDKDITVTTNTDEEFRAEISE
jgi:hypothetical protein